MVNVGSTLIALKYKDGVMIGTDTQCSYGSMSEVKNFQKMDYLCSEGIYACSGEMSDFQNLQKHLDEKFEYDEIQNDGACFMHIRDYHNYVAGRSYNARTKSPCLVTTVMGGIDKRNGEVFLGYSNSHGLKIEQNWIATGFGNHFCTVLLDNEWRADLSADECKALIEKCLTVMFWRDKLGHDQIQIGNVTKEGSTIGQMYKLKTDKNLRFFHEMTNDHFRPLTIR